MASTVPFALRKQLEAAEKCFADRNIKVGKMHADMAAALFSSAPEAQCAQAAFKVHSAASNKDKLGKSDPYAVLGIKLNATGKPDATTPDAVRKQHKALCAQLATAKDPSAAVAAACKLVDEAFSALTDIKKIEMGAPQSSSQQQQQQQVARRKAKQRQEEEECQARAAAYQEEEEDAYYGSGRGKVGRSGMHSGF
uniref:J domain-containing protein n=1 Tax=Leersia perrieri TaxID=77586 RepID=A0A0D9V7V2_9ORYZ